MFQEEPQYLLQCHMYLRLHEELGRSEVHRSALAGGRSGAIGYQKLGPSKCCIIGKVVVRDQLTRSCTTGATTSSMLL